jgi:2-oxoglutarate ferredoxin oxidoreductase subunit alpha
MQTINTITIKFGGAAGEGLMTTGVICSKLFHRAGFFVFAENDYPSLIRGGHNTMTVRASEEKIYSLDGKIDIYIAFDKRSVLEHINEIEQNGILIFDSKFEKELSEELKLLKVKLLPIPLSSQAINLGDPLFLNQISLGAICKLLNLDFEILKNLLLENFSSKGEEIVQKNIQAASFGFSFIEQNFSNLCKSLITQKPQKNLYLLNANDALCLASIKAGLKFVAEYPMSPSSSILHWMAKYAQKFNIVVKQTEDEIAAINYVLGAAYAGVRAMTATSGGGFSLMTEALGNAGLAEIPCVIVNVQRAGPSTGLPTYTDQADLQFVMHASQGEFPRIVCMPGDVAEAFYETFNVWNMAELVQTPAIILLDKYLAESLQSVQINTSNLQIKRGMIISDEELESKKEFLRHKITPSGISPRAFPGQKNGMHVASSYEHDESGYTSEDPQNRVMQIDKRARKLNAINPQLFQPVFFGDIKAPILIVSWGSTKGVILEALKHFKRENIPVRFMHIKYAIPFATDTIKEALLSHPNAIIFEGNSTGQMRNYIREKTGILIENVCLKYDARPFEVKQIVQEVKKLYSKI